MSLKIIYIIFLILGFQSHCFSQRIEIDSCGLDSEPFLNQYEITFIDSLILPPFSTKKSGVIDPKKGFDFKNKKIAFYSCKVNADTKGRGFISKKKFFNLVKPAAKGHAGKGLFIFSEKEKKESNGFDAILVISCPYDLTDKKTMISKLVNQKD